MVVMIVYSTSEKGSRSRKDFKGRNSIPAIRAG